MMIAACSKDKQAANEAENTKEEAILISPEQFKANDMSLVSPSKMSFEETISVNGYIDVPPEFKASISTFYPGYVKKITLIDGNFVKKGQVLFQLENPEYVQMQLEYLEAKAKLDYLKNEYERQKTLAEEEIAAQKNYLKAKSEYEVTKTICEGSAKKIRLLGINPTTITSENVQSSINVYAPISGYVSNISVTQGKILMTDEVALVITNMEHLHAELNVFEKDIAGIRLGQKINYTISNKEYLGDVHLISKSVSAEKRTISVHGHLNENQTLTDLYPGMYVDAKISKESIEKLGIPESAVVEIDSKFYILVKQNNNQLEFKKVLLSNPTFSNEFVTSVEIIEGIEVLNKGAFDVLVE